MEKYKGEITEWENKGELSFSDGGDRPEKVYEEDGSQRRDMNPGEYGGQGRKPGEGYNRNQSISIINILTVIATYGSDMRW